MMICESLGEVISKQFPYLGVLFLDLFLRQALSTIILID